MKTAVLAVLVAADAGLSVDDIAENFGMDKQAVEDRLDTLEKLGHVEKQGSLYFACDQAQDMVAVRSSQAVSSLNLD